ncbi:hypothetical protein ACSMXM_13610 [Pacificimonas sp. ICDLI1SI03]|uniref:hypothetical protein n=1 Tax=Erythrobacter sp. SAORIC-644 TaxID=1869314 RepID=UPI001F22D4AF|nr:hypothetical protein [Erythrobacter sp. SAORIC-644]MDF1835644.1 hypothetical protein [Alteraurantiacibacter sp. bin_em_oilr2.035]|tara:strand:- start:102 stop:467 length:366 start_codon:yes stop_codon:yes gene_type:complete
MKGKPIRLARMLVLPLIAFGLAGPAYAQQSNPIAALWSLGDQPSCDAGQVWVFFADGFHAEVRLPDGQPSAAGIWRDEGEAIAYTHVHMPFERHARAMPVRHLTVERRPAENWARENEDVS